MPLATVTVRVRTTPLRRDAHARSCPAGVAIRSSGGPLPCWRTTNIPPETVIACTMPSTVDCSTTLPLRASTSTPTGTTAAAPSGTKPLGPGSCTSTCPVIPCETRLTPATGTGAGGGGGRGGGGGGGGGRRVRRRRRTDLEANGIDKARGVDGLDRHRRKRSDQLERAADRLDAATDTEDGVAVDGHRRVAAELDDTRPHGEVQRGRQVRDVEHRVQHRRAERQRPRQDIAQ